MAPVDAFDSRRWLVFRSRRKKILLVVQSAQHRLPAEFAKQVADDKTFLAALIKELNIKLE
ncbi:MAG: hypothetical protein AB7F22_00100 [Reyranella sp.]|uniref:hypothetical protein n=1 Tax=Reyranella sp. TaxID=1929291 RepID=UPI003D145DC3